MKKNAHKKMVARQNSISKKPRKTFFKKGPNQTGYKKVPGMVILVTQPVPAQQATALTPHIDTTVTTRYVCRRSSTFSQNLSPSLLIFSPISAHLVHA